METEKLLINEKEIDQDIEKSCIICFENFIIKDVAILNCGHYFHLNCINKWFKKEGKCPICRSGYNVIEIIKNEPKKNKNKCTEKCIKKCIIS